MDYEQPRAFIYRNARPLDLARWTCHFEGKSRDEVLGALAVYQNEDGGFGHALEADCWNPHSSPLQTWTATRVIREIGFEDGGHPVIRGILRYLESDRDFDGRTWANTVPTNNDYPHAPWWTYRPDQPLTYNPTASLIGFILRFADQQLLERGRSLAREAYTYFKSHHPLEEMHTAAVFVELYESLQESGIEDVIDLAEFKALLCEQIRHSITRDTAAWATDYVCKPSLFIRSQSSTFYPGNEAICDAEAAFIRDTQADDGSWAVTWTWADDPEAWSISKNWWKADLIIRNLLFVQAMEA